MIRIKYKALFSLQFTHAYYKTGKCPDILVVPSAECNTTLHALGLRFLQTDSGASIYAKVNETDKMMQLLPENTKLTFLLQLKNNLFHNITDINLLRSPGQVFYFNNLAAQNAAEGPILVSDTNTKIVTSDDLVRVATNFFNFADSGTTTSKTATLTFIDSGDQLTQTVDNVDNTFNFSFDLNKSNRGRAVLNIDGTEKSSFYALNTAAVSDLFGIAEIYFNASLPESVQFLLADGTLATKHFQVPFGNRSTKWRYIITRKFNTEIDTLTVGKTNGTSINFAVSNGPPGTFIATSDQAIPMTETPILGIKLGANTGNPIIPNLPNPAPNLVRPEGSETFSDILITI